MAMVPHPLDSVFQDIYKAESAFMKNSHVKKAFAEAKQVYISEVKSKRSPGYCGPGAAQLAREAFLAKLKNYE